MIGKFPVTITEAARLHQFESSQKDVALENLRNAVKQCQAAGIIPTVMIRHQQPLAQRNYVLEIDVREVRD